MASTASGLLAWVHDYLTATVDGTGSYTYNLSNADAVVLAGFPSPGQALRDGPMVYVYDEEIESTPGQPMTAWNQEMRVYLLGIVQGSGTSASYRRNALDLAADLARAFRADRVASGATILATSAVHDVRFESETMEGEAMGFRGRGLVLARLTITYRGDL